MVAMDAASTPLRWLRGRKGEYGVDRLVRCLRPFGMRLAGNLGHGTPIVEYGYELWAFGDNGGELNLWKLNHWSETVASIPYVEHNLPVDPWTMAYRISHTIKGKPVDWQHRMDAREMDAVYEEEP